jgi:hypothetical protein
MIGLRIRKPEATEARPAINAEGKAEGRRDDGFAMVMVLFITTLLAILGATTLIMAAYTMSNARSSMPAAKAFDAAEAGISAAHAKIVSDKVDTSTPLNYSNVMGVSGSSCVVSISGARPDWTITSTGAFTDEKGQTYKRKIEEKVSYEGSSAFSYFSDYLMYAGHDININANSALNLIGNPCIINGNMRAEHEVNITCWSALAISEMLSVNGTIEATGGTDGGINIYANSILGVGWINLNGNLLTNKLCSLTGDTFYVNIFGLKIAVGWGRVAANGLVKCGTFSKTGSVTPGTLTPTTGYSGLSKISALEPDFEYYKTVAKQQGNYYEGINKSFSGTFSETGSSAITVYYVAKDAAGNGGNINISGNWTWANTNMAGIFVCEGDFTQSATVTIQSACKMQVIAKGNTNCSNKWTIATDGTPQFFFYASGNVNLSFALFAGCRMGAFAKNDINCTSVNILNTSMSINPNPNFALDVRGWPIDLTVKSWKELTP